MSNFKPIDGSKEDFRKYLDRKGVLDAITKVLIKCNSDRPENAIQYLMDNMGERLKDKDTIARLEADLNDARNEIEMLKRELDALKLDTTTSMATGSISSSGSVPPGNVVDSADQEDGSNEGLADTSSYSNGNVDKETTKQTDTIAAVETVKSESNPQEPATQ